MPTSDRSWSLMFMAAALFNFVFGLPLMLAPGWCYRIAFIPPLGEDAMGLRFWSDFGFAVVLIGVGYYIVSRDLARNHGLVWLGIAAKGYDVAVLVHRFAIGLAKPLVLAPALVDGGFALLFILFLRRYRARRA